MLSSAIGLFTKSSPQKRLPSPPNVAPPPRGEKRNAPSSPAVSDETTDVIPNENIFVEKIERLEGRVSSLSDMIENQNDRILLWEKTLEHQKIISKSSNIIVYGISEELWDGDVRQLFGGDRDLPSPVDLQHCGDIPPRPFQGQWRKAAANFGQIQLNTNTEWSFQA